ncbi:MAG: DUF1329 domain-containing protein, partial [Solimonas sp.]
MSSMRKAALAAVVACVVSGAAQATATPEEAAKLGKELTPVGAIRAGNADGSIPEWTGEKNFPDETKHFTRAKLEDLRKNKPDELEAKFRGSLPPDVLKPIATITAANMAQYGDKLTEGHKALLKKYPTYKMNVYKSVRTAFYPDAIYKATAENATKASLEGTDSIKNAKLGFPFPIPKSGAEVVWNHKLKYKGSSARRFNNQAIVKPDGSY